MVEVYIPSKKEFVLLSVSTKISPLVVGDKVIINNNELVTILHREKVLFRLRGDNTRYSIHTKHTHVLAANIDMVVIVAAVANPAFHPRFVDRFLILCQYCEIPALLCLNKCDITHARNKILNWYRDCLKLPIIETSVTTGIGIKVLQENIQGKMVALVGHSGVGKTSILNFLLPTSTCLRTQDVGHKGKGRHTTTASNLYTLSYNTYIIDIPGIRALNTEAIPREYLKHYFSEFSTYTCKYHNCYHDQEPGCGVKEAAQRDSIFMSRYQSYLSMLKGYR